MEIDMDFFNHTGRMAIGSRLRLLTDKITKDSASLYELYGIDLKPKWFPVFYVLSQEGAKSITAIAKEIGHTHPSVSNIAKEMKSAGIVTERKDKEDGRRNVLSLTVKGKRIASKIEGQYDDVSAAIDRLGGESQFDLWEAIGEWERLLDEKSLFERVKEERRRREGADIDIVAYEDKYHEAFKSLNVEWIERYFRMEAEDYVALDDVHGHILGKGGRILIALYKGEPVGCISISPCPYEGYEYEIAKYAVSPSAQGKGIGNKLMSSAIETARSLGCRKLFIESNRVLAPAIHLYRKFGFIELSDFKSEYERSNIQMELSL